MVFLLISVVVFLAVTFLAPKKIKRSELYAVALFSIVLGFVTDITADLKYNVYGYIKPGVQFTGFLPILILFPTAGILYMNFFPFNKAFVLKLRYTFFWTIFCLTFEFLSIKSGYFYHNGWKYWHSALTYPFLFWLHILHLRFFRWFAGS
ncbi:CBO0543 family protein [Virgibacillus kekensis]|uniref:CBO0543 family protein n=1 Tax=Virgibacillus kekensis TaxID=202261 RepID=A0ABV9DP99_9BACI